MREIKTEIQISSKPDRVWSILMDLPGWAEWNPIVNKIEGDLKVGSTLDITMCNDKGKDSQKYKGTITALDENKRFSFVAKMIASFLFSVDRIIELKDSDEGTFFTQKEVYTGLMVSLFWNKLNDMATKMLNSMNEALKKKSEG